MINVPMNFNLSRYFIGTNLLSKFHEDWPIKEKFPAPLQHGFHNTRTIFALIQGIIKTNVLTKFHKDWTMNVTSRENCHTPWQQFFQTTGTNLELIQDIIGTQVLSKLHADKAITLASRVLQYKYITPDGRKDGRKDGGTERQTDRQRLNNIPLPMLDFIPNETTIPTQAKR
ncbi:hypothetical protein DPMN_061867 [Dreissena polymorpha]|uniref:Uncharacterized protein n=1 Tax=Dreissena polymorpha TaxID=45954 RepID=A0A9D4C8R3_DREPO|nr:hypothetical protein DPMN_061867 [Dreissena polymorpha]